MNSHNHQHCQSPRSYATNTFDGTTTATTMIERIASSTVQEQEEPRRADDEDHAAAGVEETGRTIRVVSMGAGAAASSSSAAASSSPSSDDIPLKIDDAGKGRFLLLGNDEDEKSPSILLVAAAPLQEVERRMATEDKNQQAVAVALTSALTSSSSSSPLAMFAAAAATVASSATALDDMPREARFTPPASATTGSSSNESGSPCLLGGEDENHNISQKAQEFITNKTTIPSIATKTTILNEGSAQKQPEEMPFVKGEAGEHVVDVVVLKSEPNHSCHHHHHHQNRESSIQMSDVVVSTEQAAAAADTCTTYCSSSSSSTDADTISALLTLSNSPAGMMMMPVANNKEETEQTATASAASSISSSPAATGKVRAATGASDVAKASEQQHPPAGVEDACSSPPSSTSTVQKKQPPPSSSSTPAGVKQQPTSENSCRRHLTESSPPPTAAVAKQPLARQQQRHHHHHAHAPREEQSFADARPCIAHAPTLVELQSQSFSDYVRNTVLRAALPRYRPEGQDDDNEAPGTMRASKKNKTTPRSAAAAAREDKQSDANNNGDNSDIDSDDDEKVIIVEPDWAIQPMPLTQGMAKVTLPPGFWGQDGIGQDTTGRGPAWRAGTALGDLRIHSPIQQHVRGMAGIYEYTFMDHTSDMTIAEFRTLADDYQESQIPLSLCLRTAKKKTPPQPPKKKKSLRKDDDSPATTASSIATTISAEVDTEKGIVNPNDDTVVAFAVEAVQKSDIKATNNNAIAIISSHSEMEADDSADAKKADPKSDVATDGDGVSAAAADGIKDRKTDDVDDPAVHAYSNERIHKLEEKFWKRLGPTMSPAIYGADQEGTLFGDDPASGWSLDDLDSCLHVLPKDVPGVTSPYLYVGMWASVFCAHAEDMNLLSINYLHAGAPKIWYAIAPGADAQRFGSLCEFHFLHGSSASAARPPPIAMNRTMGPSPSSRKRKKGDDTSETTSAPRMSTSGGGGKTGKPQYCKEFLRHKRTLLSPKILQRAGIRYTTTIQRPGDAIITFPSGYHFGFNIGFNVAEATNFAVPEWIPYGLTAKVCMCRPDSVRIDMTRLIQLLQLYQKDLAERAAAAKRRYKNTDGNGFLTWKEWRQLREEEKEKRQSKKKKQGRCPGGGGGNKGGRMNLVMTCSVVSEEQKSDQQRRNEFWVEVVKPVAKKDRPRVQLMSLAEQLRNSAAAAVAKKEEKLEEPIILEGKRKRKKSAKAAALEQEEQVRLLEKQQLEQQQTSPVVESTQTKAQTAATPTNEIWHLAKPLVIPATGARNTQRRRLEVHTRVLCLLPGTVMASDDYNVDNGDDKEEEEDEQCFAGQVVELSEDHVLVHMDGLPRSEDFWLPINSPKLFLDGGRWKDDSMVEGENTGAKRNSSTSTGLPKLHYWQEIDSKDRDLSNEEND